MIQSNNIDQNKKHETVTIFNKNKTQRFLVCWAILVDRVHMCWQMKLYSLLLTFTL